LKNIPYLNEPQLKAAGLIVVNSNQIFYLPVIVVSAKLIDNGYSTKKPV